MTTPEQRSVLVGVSPSPSGRQALRRAVREAQRRDATLHLLRVWSHIGRFSSTRTAAEVAALRAQERAEMAILSDAAAIAHEFGPDLHIVFEFALGELFATPATAARDAELLVIGAGQPHSGSALIGQWCTDNFPGRVLIVDAPTQPKSRAFAATVAP